jgi:hypothetical protein
MKKYFIFIFFGTVPTILLFAIQQLYMFLYTNILGRRCFDCNGIIFIIQICILMSTLATSLIFSLTLYKYMGKEFKGLIISGSTAGILIMLHVILIFR